MKRKIQCVVIVLFAGMLIGDSTGILVTAADNEKTQTENTDSAGSTDSFFEEGTTQISVTSQELEFAVSGLEMIIEEVYVQAGDTVSDGDALYKIEAESLNTALAYYKKQIAAYEETKKAAQIAYDTGLLEAQYEQSETKLTAETAQAAYDAAMSELEVGVQEKLDTYEQAIEEIINYQTAIDNGTYETKYAIAEKQTALTTAQTTAEAAKTVYEEKQLVYETAKTQFETDFASLQSQIVAGAAAETLSAFMTQLANEYTAMQNALAERLSAQSAAETAESEAAQATQSLESAQKQRDSEVQQVNEKIAELTESLADLNAAYEQAKRDAQTQEAEIQKEYDEAVLNGKYAVSEYNETVYALQKAVDDASEKLEELKEEQKILQSFEDGVITANESKTITAVNYEQGDTLNENIALVSYYNTEHIMISVEVPQEQIARIQVGDEVSAAISGMRGGNIVGNISSIASSKTTGGSMSNVTYAVVITIDNSEGTISSGSSATVTFCQEEENEGETN